MLGCSAAAEQLAAVDSLAGSPVGSPVGIHTELDSFAAGSSAAEHDRDWNETVARQLLWPLPRRGPIRSLIEKLFSFYVSFTQTVRQRQEKEACRNVVPSKAKCIYYHRKIRKMSVGSHTDFRLFLSVKAERFKFKNQNVIKSRVPANSPIRNWTNSSTENGQLNRCPQDRIYTQVGIKRSYPART